MSISDEFSHQRRMLIATHHIDVLPSPETWLRAASHPSQQRQWSSRRRPRQGKAREAGFLGNWLRAVAFM